MVKSQEGQVEVMVIGKGIGQETWEMEMAWWEGEEEQLQKQKKQQVWLEFQVDTSYVTPLFP